MADISWIADALADAVACSQPVVLATVVRTEGSTPTTGCASLVTYDPRAGEDGARGFPPGAMPPTLVVDARAALDSGRSCVRRYALGHAHAAEARDVDVRYVGALGPKRRTVQMLADLNVGNAAARLHAPVGLDLGAETPEEIALAITAEILGVLNGSPATPRRDRRGGIRAPASGET